MEKHPTADWPEPARLLAEQVRLQTAMIELLNEQLRKHRAQEQAQAEELRELKRLIRVRDDLLYLRGQEVEQLQSAPPLSARLLRWLRRSRGAVAR